MRSMNILALATFAGVLAMAPLQADTWDKKTTITINAPVQIPSTTLQPGTYTLKLMDSSSDRHIVTVWDKDGMHLITTILAIPNYRLTPTDKSKFTFWETASGQPSALRAWFYPGDNFGQEFAYPKTQAQQLSMATHSEVPALSERDEVKYGGTATATPTEPSQVATTEPSPTPTPAPSSAKPDSEGANLNGSERAAVEPAPSSVAAAPAPSSSSSATVAPEPAPSPAPTAAAAEQAPAEPTPATMPQTASNSNEIMAAGFLLAVTGLSTFMVRKKQS